LYKAVAQGLRDQHAIKLKNPPRMLDFANFACAALPALSISGSVFLNAYRLDRSRTHDLALESSPIGHLIEDLVSGVPSYEWSGTHAELLQTFQHTLGSHARARGFPSTPEALRGELKRIQQI
jgi:hypothetical protein